MVLSVGSTKTDCEQLIDGTELGCSQGNRLGSSEVPMDGKWLNDSTTVGTIEGYEDCE